MGDSDGDGIDDELDDDCESDECGTRAPDVSESSEPIAVPPEDGAVLHLPYDAPEEMTQWPKRVFARRDSRGGHAIELFLHYPEATETAARRIHFTADMFERWLAARSETRNAHAVATWGTKTTIDVTLSTIDANRQLVWTPGNADTRYSLDVYNLDPSQPKWRRVLERTFAILPIEHVRAANLKSVFLDFRVGTSRIGPSTPVGDGGTNWRVRIAEDGTRTATRGIDPEGCSCVCATFAALNRAWGQRDIPDASLPATDGAIDTSFDDPSFVMFTFYHELGHLLDYGGWTRTVQLPGARRRMGGAARNALWGRYRDVRNYDGESDGAGEGFAEAYRMRMQGQAFAASHSRLDPATTRQTLTDMNDAFTSLGVPEPSSINAAWDTIRANLGAG